MIKIFNADQIKYIDHCTIENQSISSTDLMERASLAIYEILLEKIDPNIPVYIFAGSGNNGGDALALGRMLLIKHYKLHVYLINPNDKLSPDCHANWQRLVRLQKIDEIENDDHIPVIPDDCVVIDGIFGSGLNRSIDGVYQKIIYAINQSSATIYSIDMPSGLFLENNSTNNPNYIIQADEVFTFQFPKLSLLLPDNRSFCKKMNIVDINLCFKCISDQHTNYYYIEKNDISSKIHKRNVFGHKGDYGKAMIISGSFGRMGASVMAAKACLRTGVGFLTMYIPRCGIDILQIAVPESMVQADIEHGCISIPPEDNNIYTLGIGPGIGQHEKTVDAVDKILSNSNKPLVIDADALNIIAKYPLLKKKLPAKSILTPHVVEFERFYGEKFTNSYDRLQAARSFSQMHDVFIVLKGAYTAIISPDRNVFFNSTGNPGMDTGGSGDVLTGMITSLLAQKYSSFDAAIIGVYLHGYAGDLAAKSRSEQSMLPSDIVDYIGKAYNACICKKNK